MRGRWGRYKAVARHIAMANLDLGKGDIFIGVGVGAIGAYLNKISGGAGLCQYEEFKI